MTFASITNRGDFFSDHYLDVVLGKDLGELRSRWKDHEAADKATARSRLKGLGKDFFAARGAVTDTAPDSPARRRAIEDLNAHVLEALGLTVRRRTLELTHTTTEALDVAVAATVDTGSGLHLVAVEASMASNVDDLFDDSDQPDCALLEPATRGTGSTIRSISVPSALVGELFAVDGPPRWVVVVAGRLLLLAERARWAEGRFLAVDLDGALERSDTKARGELETIAGLFSTDALVPHDGQAVIDQLSEESTKHAVGVSKELREGIRRSIEILANEVIQQRRAGNLAVYSGPNRIDPRALTTQCLRFLYRLLVLLYAESRPELGIVPVDDEVYVAGYSLDRLRELVLVDLDTDTARNGTHLDTSLRQLFALVNRGHHAEGAQTSLLFAAEDDPGEASYEDYLQFPGLDAQLFDPKATPLLDSVALRNEALQTVLRLLLVSHDGRDRGFISYAQLGINQLGAVYEGLMAYTGFFADTDLYEVAKDGDPTGGTWVLPVDDADDYPDDVFVTQIDEVRGHEERVRHARGDFVFRLSGRDRQRSASYYTPEVLTSCVVRHALAELLGMDDHAPEHGSSGITEAQQILDLTICEPALGSGAFLNEAINQLSAEYLRRRQAELGEALDPEQYRRELQKVKAHFALHQSYGVDLNATAVELAEVSLWLNCMHPGLKAPWFGMTLRRGNSLVGCRRATWRTGQLSDRPWARTKKDRLQPPVDRPLTEALGGDEVHHFLLPGHGWAAVADRKEARELRPDAAKRLKAWRKAINKAPSKRDAERLEALAAGVERLWEAATRRLQSVQRQLRRPIDVWGADPVAAGDPIPRELARRALENPDSPLGRLRTVMDAWVGLWFWELDTDVSLPDWERWLMTMEALVEPESVLSSGQLDFDDLASLLEDDAEQARHYRVSEVMASFPWLAEALRLARREGAWHWPLEFAPAFGRGGFDLQVGNPPWVRLDWQDDLTLAEFDPWWGVTAGAAAATRVRRRAVTLATELWRASYIRELSSASGLVDVLGSPVLRPVLAGVRDNLYMLFLDTVWLHAHPGGASGLLHPESHFTDPSAAQLRRAAYLRQRRHIQLSNHLDLFDEIATVSYFSVNTYGHARSELSFLNISGIVHPEVADASTSHDGTGPPPALRLPNGEWDVRPHQHRVLIIDEQALGAFADLLDEEATPAIEARLLRPVGRDDLAALTTIAKQERRLTDAPYDWTQGWNETNAKSDGYIEWNTRRTDDLDDVVLQGPHFTLATPYAKEPNENCRSKADYSEWDLERLPAEVIPRTNYQRACDRETYVANLDHWGGEPSTNFWRVIYREMTQPGLERSLQPALLPPGAAHVGTVVSVALDTPLDTSRWGGLLSTIPYDYFLKVTGSGHVKDYIARRMPLPAANMLDKPLILRTLRLNALTEDYAPLWGELFDRTWRNDAWTLSHSTVELGDVEASWSMNTPLRRDVDRRLALVELDALAALMLGLTAEQLCAMYRTQFAVLRKYEHVMAFDSEGRKLCAHHHSYGYRQRELQDAAKAGELPKPWKRIWSLFEQEEDEPGSVDWMGHYTPPFHRPDREAEMTAAFQAFQNRLDSGYYDD